MQRDVLVESQTYDHLSRGTWRGYRIHEEKRLGDELEVDGEGMQDRIRLWLPAGTPMNWSTGTRPLRYHCLQLFWPGRWYMLSAFYKDRTLIHTYANVIEPPFMSSERLSYTELDLSILVKPDMTYEVLTQAEFEQAAELLDYSEEVRISALMALRTLTSSIQRSVGLFAVVPHQLDRVDFHLMECSNK